MRINTMIMKFTLLVIGAVSLLAFLQGCKDKETQVPDQQKESGIKGYDQQYRPQYHFSPREKWMNDPNGLVYNDGLYHLFYQYYPADIVWGPMHWGHATSADLVYWKHKSIALFPDDKGYIFSGSAVADENNTSGFARAGETPLVAIYTYHDPDGEKAGAVDYQSQGIAYSLDNGETWTKYQNNPVIPNTTGIKDFRDPKVFWHQPSAAWIMVLVAGDHARIYSSPDLKSWEYLSEFGRDKGAHGGVWECPDLFPLTVEGSGEQKWVMIISINPGAPNGGSGTQYFVGDFDGVHFRTEQEDARWVDWGTDNYAGVTYNQTPGEERIFIGWMSNWAYATSTPTAVWRSAMTVPRKLSLGKSGGSYFLRNFPLDNLGTIFKTEIKESINVPASSREVVENENFNQAEVRFRTEGRDFAMTFANREGDSLQLRFAGSENLFELDRRQSGKTDFSEAFGNAVHRMPLVDLPEGPMDVRILMDRSSAEIFINRGQYAFTSQVFPNEPYTSLTFRNKSSTTLEIEGLEVNRAESIWDQTPE